MPGPIITKFATMVRSNFGLNYLLKSINLYEAHICLTYGPKFHLTMGLIFFFLIYKKDDVLGLSSRLELSLMD